MSADPARRLYWRLLRVPFVGRRVQRAVEFGKANIRRVASTDVDAIRETVQLHASAIDGLWKRIEFVREETLFELRAAIKSAPTAELAPVRSEILNGYPTYPARLDCDPDARELFFVKLGP